jgi:hypothetical protein
MGLIPHSLMAHGTSDGKIMVSSKSDGMITTAEYTNMHFMYGFVIITPVDNNIRIQYCPRLPHNNVDECDFWCCVLWTGEATSTYMEKTFSTTYMNGHYKTSCYSTLYVSTKI